MAIKSIHTYLVIPVAIVSMGISAIQYNVYKVLAWQVFKDRMMQSFTIETRAIDKIGKRSILENMPNVTPYFGCVKSEMRMIDENKNQKMVCIGYSNNWF